MKQIFQDYRTGEFRLEDVPVPTVRPGHLLVRTAASAVSVGTEKSTVELAKKSLVGKALARPDLVRQVVAKVRAEGLTAAWRASMGRLEVPVALGYSSSGVVVAVGDGVAGFRPGDRVACSGQGFAGHAEVAVVPASLAVPVPSAVPDDAASFAAIGGIALHAARLARAKPGDAVVVVGLGLLGQLAVQILRARGARVFAVDTNPARVALAVAHGAEEGSTDASPAAADRVRKWAGTPGVRAVVILAATPSNGPLELAAECCGDRGRVVAAGLVGLTVPRRPFFEKELELVVSRAWGAGSLPTQIGAAPADPEDAAASATLAEFVELLARGDVRLDRVVTHRFPFSRALDAYDLILTGREPFLGVVLEYGAEAATPARVAVASATRPGRLRLGVLGAGQFARGTLLPILHAIDDVAPAGLATNRPVEARKVAEKFGFGYCTGDVDEVLRDPDVDAVAILTRHSSHAELAAKAIEAGKKVFLEKPLATSFEGLARVRRAHAAAREPFLMVGFNRTFAPATRFLLGELGPGHGPLAVHCTVNAGAVDPGSWQNNPEEGGGRLVGEACHFVDLVQTLTGASPVEVSAVPLAPKAGDEDVHLTMRMSDGSVGTVLYSSRGARSYPRERVEVVGDGVVGVIENFKRATFHRGDASRSFGSRLDVDRGHRAEMVEFVRRAAAGLPPPVPFARHVETTLVTLHALESLAKGAPVRVPPVAEGAA